MDQQPGHHQPGATPWWSRRSAPALPDRLDALVRRRFRPAWITLLVLVSLWLGIGVYLVEKRDLVLEGAAQASRNLSYAFEENIRRTIESIDTTIRATRAARDHNPAHFNLAAWVHDSGLTSALTLQLSLSDRDGNVVASNLGPVTGAVSISDRPHFIATRDQPGDELFISRPVLGRVSGKWSVQLVRKLFDAEGQFDGVIVASLDPAFLARFYQSLSIGRGALILAGQDGTIRVAAPAQVAALGADLSATPLMAAAAQSANGVITTDATADHLARIYGWRRLQPYGLLVAVGLSRADVLGHYQTEMWITLLIGLVMTLVTLLVSLALTRNRRALIGSQQILQAAVGNISQGLVLIDAQGRVPLMNDRAIELAGLPAALCVPGADMEMLLNCQVAMGEFDAAQASRLSAALRGPESGLYHRTRPDGTVLEIRTRSLPNGGAVSTLTDITAQQQAARVLAEARDAAEAASRARSAFLAVMSHEIRTPLNGVIGVAALLDALDLGPTERDYVRLIRDSGHHLLQLINDILDYSRLEASRVQLEEACFSPRALVQGAVDLFRAQASTKGLQLAALATEAVPLAVLGDPGRLRQVLLNLVGNAIKFTDHGGVTVGLEAVAGQDGRVRLLFSVADTGIGMAPDAVERMFQEFTQMDASTSRRFGGSGLGLAICRGLVELMGGNITVETQPGSGSVFRFDVTAALADAALVPVDDGALDPEAATATGLPVAPPTSLGLRVLLAEDNATNQLVAMRMLAGLGHQAEAVGNGAEAVAAVHRADYDLVVMDVMMPLMDGLTATRLLRAAPRPGPWLPVVGLTAGSRPEDLSACLAAGMDAVTTKPMTLERLRRAIAEGLAAAAQHVPEPASGVLPVRRRPVALVPPPALPERLAIGAPTAGEPPRLVDNAESGTVSPRLRELAADLGEAAVAEIIEAFAEDAQSRLRTMRDSVVRGERASLFRESHSMMGAARNVGAVALAARAASLEHDVARLSAEQIMTEIAAMERELAMALDAMGILPPREAPRQVSAG